MTNLILLCVALFQTNTLPYGATDEFGGWDTSITWNVELTYAAQTSGVYCVEFNYDPSGPKPMVDNGRTNGWIGMRWTTLNCGGLTNGVYNGMGAYPASHSAPRGYYTNTFTNWSTNTIRVPFPYGDYFFFRLKRVGEA